MVFVKYAPEVKVIVVKLLVRGVDMDDINNAIDAEVCKKTMRRWFRLFTETQNVLRDPALYEQRGRPFEITTEATEFVLDVLKIDPTMYLDEIQTHLEITTGVLHPIMTLHDTITNRLNLTLKTARTVHPAQCPLKRAAYVTGVGPWPSEFLVFVDECAVSQDSHRRTKAWAPKGRRTDRIHREHNAKRISVLPAVSLDGLLTVIAQEGSINRLDFEYFLEEVLLPGMNPFPARNSVLIMDNAKIHHGGRIAELCTARQVLLMYLPPYSPDYNPIEKVFSVLKSRLKRAQILTGNASNAELIKQFLPSIVTPDLMRALFSGSGYP